MYDYFMEKLVWQMFILGSDNLNEILLRGLGGVIFFTKDITNENEFKKFIQDIKHQAIIPPFLAIDQEGGRVERTENIYPRKLSARDAFKKSENFLRSQASQISKELSMLGINLNFAPCVDVNTNPNNPIIGERAFADNPNDVISGMDIYINEFRKNKIIPCVKHYPGHGDADKDSHLTLPCIDLPLFEMEEIHIKPFKHAIVNNIEMIMAAHLHCTCFDKEPIPTSLSYNALNYLRNTLGYKGVIISDDMVMNGVNGFDSLDAIIQGVKAGLDMFIFRDSSEKTLNIISNFCAEVKKDKELQEKVALANQRITDLKSRYII